MKMLGMQTTNKMWRTHLAKILSSILVLILIILFNNSKAYAISGSVTAPAATTSSTVQVRVTLNGTASNCSVAVWSHRNGQDDLRWYWNYSAASSYTFNINLANHDSSGNAFAFHVYVNNNSTLIKDVNTFWIPSNLSISANIPSYTRDGKVTVTVTSNQTVVYGCQFPTWSNKNGQDDITWYSDGAEKTSYSYTINLANHGSNGETFSVHVYAYGSSYYVTKNENIIWDGTGPSVSASNITYGSNLTATISDGVSGLSRICTYHFNVYTV